MAISLELSPVAVVSHTPGCVWADGGSVMEGRMDVEVAGGICKNMETVGVRVMGAIIEREMPSYTVAIAVAREDVRCSVA